MESYLNENELKKEDKAWLVIDRDQWPEEKIQILVNWVKKDLWRGLAVSNPGFELWLLFHFENGKGIKSIKECLTRLKRHIPDYEKELNSALLFRDKIKIAINHAKEKDSPPCSDWPKTNGSTVYRIVEKLIENP